MGETMAETRGIYAYTPAACVEQARPAGGAVSDARKTIKVTSSGPLGCERMTAVFGAIRDIV